MPCPLFASIGLKLYTGREETLVLNVLFPSIDRLFKGASHCPLNGAIATSLAFPEDNSKMSSRYSVCERLSNDTLTICGIKISRMADPGRNQYHPGCVGLSDVQRRLKACSTVLTHISFFSRLGHVTQTTCQLIGPHFGVSSLNHSMDARLYDSVSFRCG